MRLLAPVLFVSALAIVESLAPTSAQGQEGGTGYTNPDSIQPKEPTFSYDTSYDRDRTRELWTQSAGYSNSTNRTMLNLGGSINTLGFVRSSSKSTTGSLNGAMNFKLVKTWLLVLDGRYGMYSTTDGINAQDSRDNKLRIQTQYQARPVTGMTATGVLYSEFTQEHDLNTVNQIDRVNPLVDDEATVDSSRVSHDSTYTTSRQDGVSGDLRWIPRPWLELSGNAVAFRIHPTIRRIQRRFVNPLDGTSGGYVNESDEETSNPTNNTNFNTRAVFKRLRATVITVTGERGALEQSYNDIQRSKTETVSFDKTVGTLQIENSPFRRASILVDAALGRNLNQYLLNRTRTTLTKQQRLLVGFSYFDSTRARAGLSFSIDRGKTDLQKSVNGISVDRALSGNGGMRITSRLGLDALASVTLQIFDYEDDSIDRDNLRTFLSTGGFYRVTPSCSTSVHFSRSQGHSIALDPSLSGGNAVTTTYQMNAALRLRVTSSFSVNQDYLLRAEYRISDYSEAQNSLLRSRRIDTDLIDTVFAGAFVRLTHNFVFQDQGTYAREAGESERKFFVASDSYDQTLTATAGFNVAPGVLFLATESLLNRRTHDLRFDRRTNQNFWKLNVGLQVYRTLSNGLRIDGAVRRIGDYTEGIFPGLSRADRRRDDWIAGVSFHKDF